jgi:hypothetical protein
MTLTNASRHPRTVGLAASILMSCALAMTATVASAASPNEVAPSVKATDGGERCRARLVQPLVSRIALSSRPCRPRSWFARDDQPRCRMTTPPSGRVRDPTPKVANDE